MRASDTGGTHYSGSSSATSFRSVPTCSRVARARANANLVASSTRFGKARIGGQRRTGGFEKAASEKLAWLEIAALAPFVPGVDKYDTLALRPGLSCLCDHRREPAAVVFRMRVHEHVAVVLQPRRVVQPTITPRK